MGELMIGLYVFVSGSDGRIRSHHQGAPDAAHAAHVGRQRDLRHRRHRRPGGGRPGGRDHRTGTRVLAIVMAMVNVVGGFMVTDRMLEMFKPGQKK